VAVYTTSSNSTGVKVIKINENKKGIILFEKKSHILCDLKILIF